MLKTIGLIAMLLISGLTSACVPAPSRVSIVADSMGYYNSTDIINQVEDDGDSVVHYSSVTGTTTWNNPNLVNQIKSTNNDVVVVTFGLNETRYIRGDPDATPHKTLSQVLASWNSIKSLADQYDKCLVWVSTQTEQPLHTVPTVNIINSLNSWIRSNVVESVWEPTVNYNIKYQNATWVKDDGFHLEANSWGPSAYGVKIREAVNSC